MSRSARALACVAAAMVWTGAQAQAARTLDGFDDPAAWRVIASNQVTGTLRGVDGVDGRALCLDYDFHGVSGYVGIQRDLALDYPPDYAFAFALRGDGPANDLQFKLVDASGDNVWWVNRPKQAMPARWTPVVYKKRHVIRAWGPDSDPALRRSAKLEFTIASGEGGKGSACFDSLAFAQRAPDDGSPLVAVASATSGASAAAAADGDAATAWQGTFAAHATPVLVLDLGRVREFGGLALQWRDHAEHVDTVAASDDATHWRDVGHVHHRGGGRNWVALPESEARYLRLTLAGYPGDRYALAEATIEPLAFAATPNAFVSAVAKASPRGRWPRGFVGEQPYWTLVGIDGGDEQALLGEDGAVEVAKGGFSIEPFLVDRGRLVSWADVQATQSLQDGYLPIPSVGWTHADIDLAITAFAQGTRDASQMVTRYRLTNTGKVPRDVVLALALRPLQVNPPNQFLNVAGGVSPIHALSMTRDAADVDGRRRVRLLAHADSVFAVPFDTGSAVDFLAEPHPWLPFQIEDATGLASGAWQWRVHLEPGASGEVAWIAPLTGDMPTSPIDVDASQRRVAAQWRAALDRVRIRVPKAQQHMIDSLRSNLAQMLMSRKGPRLQPGTRSYARAWIRDGAMISEALLRMGHAEVAEDFVRWYAPYQFKDGKVPCCVDDRGSDPVPENDSQGELLYAIAEVYRYTHDRALIEAMWPHVTGAVGTMDTLRMGERTEANRATNPAFFGLMPASISHEGYSAKPMHSYWDDFWSLRGYADAVAIAQWLGKPDDARRFAASRDQFRDDLHASIATATTAHAIGFIPGSAELGDFDATSTTIALAPGGELDRLPRALLEATFERYWQETLARREGRRAWKDYTPYELRTVGAFVRLGWRERAVQALDGFLADQQPRAWKQWAEVVSHTPRTPFFVGDLPHAWVASDAVRSTLDLFAYVCEGDDALVIAAGIPSSWLQGQGIAVSGLRTPFGTLGYDLRAVGGRVELRLMPGLSPPPGGIVLQLPKELTGGRATIDGVPAPWSADGLHIDRVPAHVVIHSRQR